MPRLTVEPGRAIAGPAGVTLYEVGTVKDVDGLRTYVSVDGGMSDNIRTALYGAEYTARARLAASRRRADARARGRQALRERRHRGDATLSLPADLAPGDLIAVAATGAYCRSHGQQLQPRAPGPPVVAVTDGEAR